MSSVDPKWIRGPVDVLAVEQGCYFDDQAGQLICDFIETFCCQSKGRWAGKPLTLLDWQRDFVMRLFGWKLPSGLRRFTRAFLLIAKKNGKSTLVSAIGLACLLIDGEPAPEIYLNACDREQATIIFEEERRMVEASPSLRSRLQVLNSANNRRIVHPAGNGSIIANSSVVASKDGLNPSHAIFDEVHRYASRSLWDVFEYAGAAREQYLRIGLTTAGEEEDGVWWEELEYAEKVNKGEIDDITFLGVIYRALPSDDIDDPATWEKANPSLGETIRYEDFARELEEAKQIPTKLNNFKRLRLNIVCRASEKFFGDGVWAACGGVAIVESRLRGEPFWGGLDLSSTTDLAAFASLFGNPDDGFDLVVKFWLPEDHVVELERRDRQQYRRWADEGWLELTNGSVIDYAFIRRAVNQMAGECECRKLMIDPYNATKLATELKEDDGLEVEFIRQGFLSLSAPTKELLRLVLGRKFRHGDNPILKWMAGNAIASTDAAGNIKLDKQKGRQKIDGLAATVNAVAGYTSGDDGGGSVYDTRGILTL
jgi:phage terminase large subunit-like protein